MMRRAAALALIALMLAGCGLRPLYAGGEGAPVAALLHSVSVAPIEGQSGWLVRNKLRDRLGISDASASPYRLVVTLDDNITSFGIRGDRAATFERRTLRARYQWDPLESTCRHASLSIL